MITRPCTTPHKKAYPSREDAEDQRIHDGLRYGTALYPYQCICGNWHLSRNTDQQLPAYEQPKPEDVARIRTLTNQAFAELVDDDVKNRATLADQLALRHPDNLTRWRWALKALRSKVTRQIADSRHDPHFHTWLRRAESYRNSVDLRLVECQRLRTQATQARAA